MQFSLSFFVHFILSFAGFLALGIYLCRGSWRNMLRAPLALALMLVSMGHMLSFHGDIISMIFTALMIVGMGLLARAFLSAKFKPSEVRGGHNALSMMVGAAFFALTIQLHSVLFGVPVFALVK